MKKLKEVRGITLVALVITIIILLILAGISISSLTGSGLFQKAGDAKTKYGEEEIIEKARIDIIKKQTEKIGKDITEKDLSDILNKYGTLSNNNEETILDKTLTTNEGYDISVKRIYNWTFSSDDSNTIKFTLEFTPTKEYDSYEGAYKDGIHSEYIVENGTTWEEFFNEKFSDDKGYGWAYVVDTGDICIFDHIYVNYWQACFYSLYSSDGQVINKSNKIENGYFFVDTSQEYMLFKDDETVFF